jgi:hypothetical protein
MSTIARASKCSICNESFKPTEEKISYKCEEGHDFHTECLRVMACKEASLGKTGGFTYSIARSCPTCRDHK